VQFLQKSGGFRLENRHSSAFVPYKERPDTRIRVRLVGDESGAPWLYSTSLVSNWKLFSGSERASRSDCLFMLIPARLRCA
jgi:hypothetical protein